MEEFTVTQLVAEYNSNCDKALALAFHTVSNIEIPVFNTLSTLPRQNVSQLLTALGEKFRQMSNSANKNLMITLVTDVLTSMIKYNHFYETFEGNNLSIILLLCKKIIQISRVRLHEFESLELHVNQMTKYADRIPEYIQLKKCLNSIQNVNFFRNNYSNCTIDQQVEDKIKRTSNFVPRQLYFTDANDNILKDSNSTNDLKRKRFETTKTIVKYFDCKPKNEIIKLPETKPINASNGTDQSTKLPEIKPKNAFDVLMISAKNKNAKKMKLN